MTDIDKAKVISALEDKSKFNFDYNNKKSSHAIVPAREDLSTDVPITTVGLILTQLG